MGCRYDIGWNGNQNITQLFKKTPFLVGNDPIDQILKLTKLVGAKEIVDYIKEYRLTERRGHRKDNICFDIIVAF